MSLQLSPAEAARALLARRSARRSLTDWCNLVGYAPAAHHRLIIEKLEAVSRGEIKRLGLFLPPGSAKSTYASILYPPWHLASASDAAIIAASHTAELAEKWGRKVRNLVTEHRMTLGVGISDDNKAAGRWETTGGGEYFAAGVGGSITGRRADLAIIDDPIRSREDADSDKIRDSQWDWYQFDLLTRLKPGAAIVLIQCMTGDTPVLMGDGSERPLRDIRPGDVVATYRNGGLSTSVVRNWASNGPDRVFTIKMTSGITVRANARHPFLVCEDGAPKWTKTSDLRPGQEIFRVNGASGRAKPARGTAAKSLSKSEVTAPRTTTKSDGRMGSALLPSILSRTAMRILSIATGLLARSMRACSPSRMVSVPSVGSSPGSMFALTGVENSASIIATTRAKLEGCFATIATLSSDTQKTRKPLCPQQNTSDFILDRVVEVKAAGVEEVFDIQIDRTENFIANGLVSHNTRWHEDDLAGRILGSETGWDVVSLPMEAGTDDPLGRPPGGLLWPEWFTPDMVAQAKRDTRVWSALYQQKPVPDVGAYFRADWLKPVEKLPSKESLHVYGASDYAVTSKGGDYTVHIVVGIDADNRMYVLDLWRGQADSATWIEAWCDLVKEWRPREWAEEGGQINAAVGPFLERRARERQAYTYRRQFPSRHDKSVRAQSIRARMAMNGLYVPKTVAWRADFESELLRFPAAKHDDQVDALGLIGNLLDNIRSPSKPKSEDDPSNNRSGYSAILAPSEAPSIKTL